MIICHCNYSGIYQASGSFFAGVILSLTVPLLYDKYQEIIDEKLYVAHKAIQALSLRIDKVLKKIPLASNKEKKIQ